ncbi:MAG: SMC family ATPase [Fimbriimonadaceae bacterium]|nr:SMC family ATPase [Fimbriimonadaceae bacterium]
MRLVSLKLENFRQHKSTEIAFRDGMIAIVGPNGTGKSTVVEAILFALYGKKRGTKDDVRFFWSGGRQVAKVTLVFELEDKRWTIERRENDANLSTVVDDGDGPKLKHVATSISDVKAKVESLLRLTHEQFVNSFCAEQKALAFLADKNAQGRQDEIAKMLGYDRLKDAAETAKDRQKQVEAQAKGLSEALREDAELAAALKEAQAAHAQLRADEKTLAEGRKALAEALEAAREGDARAAKWLGFLEQLNDIRRDGRAIADNLEALAKDEAKGAEEVAEFERLAPVVVEFEALETRNKEFATLGEAFRRRQKVEQDVQATRKTLTDLEAVLAKLPASDAEAAKDGVAQATAALTAARAAHRASREAWAEAKKAASNAAIEARTRYQAAKASLDRAKDLVRQGKCPTCRQPIGDDFEAHVLAHEAELSVIADKMAEGEKAAKEADRVPDQVTAAEAAEKAAEEAFRRAQSAHEEAAKRHADRTTHLTLVEAERNRLSKLEADLGEPVAYDETDHKAVLTRLTDIRPLRDRRLSFAGAAERLALNRQLQAAKKAEFAALKAKADDLLAKQSELGFESRDAADAAREAFRQRDTELKLKDAEIKGHGERVAHAQQDVDRAKKEIETNRERKLRHEALASESKHLAQTRKELNRLRERLNLELRPQLEYRAGENLDLLTGGRYRTLRLDESFSPTVVEDDNVAKGVISGGEEDVVALALRLALSELIQERHGMPMTLLILDEVFGSLDSERRQHVMDRLSALKTRFTQMVVISHIEEINQVADRCLYLKRDPTTRATVLTDAPPEMALDVLDLGGLTTD